MFNTGGATWRADGAVVGQPAERELLVHGREQVLVVVQRAGHVLDTVEGPQVRAPQHQSDPARRAVVRPVLGSAIHAGRPGPGGAAVRLGVHPVHRTSRAADQGTVRRE